MAIINSKNITTGRIGNVIYRSLDGKQIVQIHPGKIKQTKATKISSSEFRQCSSWAKELRLGLAPFLVGLTDSYMYRRFAGQFYNALLSNNSLPKGQRTPLTANMEHLEGFEFNSHSPFSDYFMPKITAVMDSQRQVTVTVPALDAKTQLLFPDGAEKADLVVLVQASNFDKVSNLAESFFSLNLEKHTQLPEATLWTSPPLPEGCFVMVSAKLVYYSLNKFTGKNYCNSKTLNPATIIFCGN